MIPVNEPLLNGNEKRYLNECIDSGYISSKGPFVTRFEEAFAGYLGIKHGAAICNGTAALEAALFAIGIEKGDEIIMPAFTIIACPIAAIRLGAKPVLVDIEQETWQMDTHQVEKKITSKTKAILAVDTYGQPVDYDPLFSLAEKYRLKIVEDFAEAHGAEYFSVNRGNKWLKCGAMGDIAATSFYANKILSTGEGGMVVTDHDGYAARARSYRDLCFIDGNRFHHEELGYTFRMTNLQAAVGLAQLERLEEFIDIKIRHAALYRQYLSGVKGIKFHPVRANAKSVYWMYCVELSPQAGVTAREMMQRLREKQIETRPFFKGLHQQPALNKEGHFLDERYPVAEHVYRYGFYIPSGITLTEEQIRYVADNIRQEILSLAK